MLRQLFLNHLMRLVDLHLRSLKKTWITSEDETSWVDVWLKLWSVVSCAVLSPPGGVPCQAEEGVDCRGSCLVSSALQSAQPASQGETQREGKSRGLLLIFSHVLSVVVYNEWEGKSEPIDFWKWSFDCVSFSNYWFTLLPHVSPGCSLRSITPPPYCAWGISWVWISVGVKSLDGFQ